MAEFVLRCTNICWVEFLKMEDIKCFYDLSFYEEWGTDMDYQFVRNFDLLKAFPYLKVKSASKLALSVYKKKYFNLGNNTYGRQDDFSFLSKRSHRSI